MTLHDPLVHLIDTQADEPIDVYALTAAEQAFSFSAIPNNDLVSGASAGPTTIKDIVWDSNIGSTIDHEYLMSAAAPRPGFPFGYYSTNEAIATVGNTSGVVNRVGDGIVGMIARRPGLTARRLDVNVYREVGTAAHTFINFASGSLAAHMVNQIDSRLAGKDPATQIKLVTGASYPMPWNPIRWPTTNVDFSGCLQWQDANTANGGYRYGATVISRNLAVGSGHTNLHTGHILNWLTPAGVQYSAVITDYMAPGHGFPYGIGDIGLYYFDVPFPVGIKTVPIMTAAQLTSYLPCLDSDNNPAGAIGTIKLPLIHVSQLRLAAIREYVQSDNPITQQASVTLEATGARAPWAYTVITGDSGTPMFMLINNELVLLAVLSGFAPMLPETYTALTDAMMAMAGQAPTIVNLAGFPTY